MLAARELLSRLKAETNDSEEARAQKEADPKATLTGHLRLYLSMFEIYGQKVSAVRALESMMMGALLVLCPLLSCWLN